MKFLLGCLGLLLLAGCNSNKPNPAESSGGERIQIFYNNDNFGYLEPCGCRVSPIGGIDRRWNAFMAYPEKSRVFVDAGNLLFKSPRAGNYLEPQWYEQARGVVEAYNVLKADAVAVGANEFALGVNKFLELAKTANFPFLSANLYWRGTNKLFVKDSIVIERQGKKIGVFALFHPDLPLPGELEARDPIAHAKAMKEKLVGQGVDFILALSHQGYEQDVQLANQVKGISLIVGAHTQSLIQNPDQEGDTLLVQLSNQGQMLGMLEYDQKFQRTNFVVTELDADYNEAPRGLANPMKNLLAITNLRMEEANKKLDQQLWNKHQGKVAGFQTFLNCKECHGKQASFQEGKNHSAAFLTLLAANKDRNLDCVKCHSVGLGAEGGFQQMKEAFLDEAGKPVPLEKIRAHLPKDFPSGGYRHNVGKVRPEVERWITAMKKAGVKKSFVSVQCENCHGGRPGHPFDDNSRAEKVALNTCLQCHTKEQMPDWYTEGGTLKKDVAMKALQSVTCPSN
jgi:hypothetical protein